MPPQVHQARHQRGHLGRRVELARLLAAGGGEVLDQELIGVADHVELADAALAEVQFGLGKVFQQVAQDVVLLLLVAQLVGVEADGVGAIVSNLAAISLVDNANIRNSSLICSEPCGVDASGVSCTLILLCDGASIGWLRLLIFKSY